MVAWVRPLVRIKLNDYGLESAKILSLKLRRMKVNVYILKDDCISGIKLNCLASNLIKLIILMTLARHYDFEKAVWFYWTSTFWIFLRRGREILMQCFYVHIGIAQGIILVYFNFFSVSLHFFLKGIHPCQHPFYKITLQHSVALCRSDFVFHFLRSMCNVN
jgi:hypothetical protein